MLTDDWYHAVVSNAQRAVLDERLHTHCRSNPLVPNAVDPERGYVVDPDTGASYL
jgi:hypothetical protein